MQSREVRERIGQPFPPQPGVQRTPSRALPAGAGDSQKGMPVGGICNRYRGRPAANNRRRCLGERRPSQDCGNFGAALGQDGSDAGTAVPLATHTESSGVLRVR
ncbi:hypothetical protein T08_2541 [Trichinella sp. T8]|nr:hypothetical protein T08_2541 [Trichinella sp. T8]